MPNGRQLRARFDELNTRYFQGKVPRYTIRVVRVSSRKGECGFCNKRRRIIKVLYGQSDEEAIGTLLHEMAHAVSTGHHGKPWGQVMIHLRDAGAPLGRDDLLQLQSNWDGTRVGKILLRTVIQEVLSDKPDATLSDVLRHFYSTMGGPSRLISEAIHMHWRSFRRSRSSECTDGGPTHSGCAQFGGQFW